MIKNGSNGYLLKNAHPTDLEKALHKLVNEGFYYPDWTSKLVFASLGGETNSNGDSTINFSEREKEFLKHSITEKSYKEIADLMYCSPRTVESYRDSLFEKLQLKTRVGLAVYALKNGFS
jgi:DNA-binding NarL/FixJ family response regulator